MNSKFLSLILRHKPETIGLQLDKNGWADIDELLSLSNSTIEQLDEIVATNNKQRFSYNVDKTKIRANQGHSIQVDLELVEQVPPERLFHGTATRNLNSIRKIGIIKGTRQHVHLSDCLETAKVVGSRHGSPAVLFIKAGQMHRDGYRFFLSDNGVWLTDSVPVQYIERN